VPAELKSPAGATVPMCRPGGFGTSTGMTSEHDLPPVIGATAEDRDGNALGTVSAVFLDDVTGEPTWVGLTDGQHAGPDTADISRVAPIAGADLANGRLRLPVSGEAVARAPRPAATDRLTPEEEVTLREHYAGGTPRGAARDVDAPARGTAGAMTRSEEQLLVDRVVEPWARAVLRVETVTEEVMVPVTVTRQQARIDYLPLRPWERGGTAEDPDGDETRGGDEERQERTSGWVTLYTEQPVVTLERVATERVRLATSWVTEQQTVSDRLRREEIALESDVPGA
jgi:hypothetical protein